MNQAPVLDRLQAEAPRFSFFQAVRLIEQLTPQAARIGHQGPPGSEAVRFRASLSLGFPTADVESVRRLPDSGEAPRYEVTATFLGIYGAASPMPTYFTEWVMALDESSMVRGFIDLFHHRVYSLFHRIQGKYRCTVPHPSQRGDSFQARLQTLLGVDGLERGGGSGIRGAFLIGYAGLIARQTRSADSLRRLLADYFAGIEVAVEQCVPRWTPLPDDQLIRLGGANSRLGQDALAGERVFNRITTFRIELGPMGWKDQESFLPGGLRHRELRELVGLFNDNGLDYEVDLSVPAADLPCVPLGDEHGRLGYTTRTTGVDQPFYRVRFLVA